MIKNKTKQKNRLGNKCLPTHTIDIWGPGERAAVVHENYPFLLEWPSLGVKGDSIIRDCTDKAFPILLSLIVLRNYGI